MRLGSAGRTKIVVLLIASAAAFAAPLPAQIAAVPVGAQLHVKIETTLSTGGSKLQEPVQAELIGPVNARGISVLPAGAILLGSVTALRRANPRSMPLPMLRVKFTRVMLPGGQSFPLQASFELWGTDVYAGGTGASPSAGGFGAEARPSVPAHHEPWDNFTLAAGNEGWLRLDAAFTAPGASSAESAVSKASAVNSTASGGPIKARLYLGSNVDTGNPVDMASLRSEIRQAGIPVVYRTADATLLLGVWSDGTGLHGALTDIQGASLWTGRAATSGELVKNLHCYLRGHPEVVAAAYRPLPVSPMPSTTAHSQAPTESPAPAFSLRAADGQTYSLQSLKGKVTLLFFWASW